MRYPNLRYGNPTEFAHYVQGIPLKDVAKRLRRTERTVHDWLTCRKRLPWWVSEIVRLQHMEHSHMMQQMTYASLPTRLGLVSGDVIEFKKPAVPALVQTVARIENESKAACG
jgi:hypothetical protein